MISLSDAFLEISARALLDGRSSPVIETDLHSAHILMQLIERDLDVPVGALRSRDRNDHVAMFDGIKIVARRPEICKRVVDGWREHFGPLAEIWS